MVMSIPSPCVMSEIENSDFPLGVWEIQKAGGSRLTESVSQNGRMPKKEMKHVPSGWGVDENCLIPFL